MQALQRIPTTSALYVAAQMAIVRILIADAPGKTGQPHDLDELRQAGEVFAALALDTQDAHLLAADLLLKAADLIAAAATPYAPTLLGYAANPKDLRLGAEKELRRAARFATDPIALIALVDRANQARPRTLF